MIKIDSHQHFWHYSTEEYPWIQKGMEVLAQDRLPIDLKPLVNKSKVNGTIAVQARQTIAETEALLKMSDDNDFIKGVVGWVDLRSPEANQQLQNFANHPKFVGVRHVLQDEDPSFMLDDEFCHGVSLLDQYDLTYDLLTFPHQLQAAIELVSRFPKQRFVLNHLAKPDIKSGKTSSWEADIKTLAEHKNVACKLSGMVTEADWDAWKPTDFTTYMDSVTKAFGTSRLMIGSDWPVCTLAADYEQVICIADDYISDLIEPEQQSIWQDNPTEWYKLKI